MSVETWMIFLMPAVIATATPGPAVFLIISKSIKYGWNKTIYLALGNICALFVMSIITVSGLGVLLKSSEILFLIIKYLGSGYLIYMGLKLFFMRQTNPINFRVDGKQLKISRKRLFLEAFTVAMSNPKAIIFLGALFPQFINTGYPLYSQFIILIFTLMALSFTFLMLYSIVANQARIWINKNDRMRIFNRISGGLFCGLGVLLGSSSNK